MDGPPYDMACGKAPGESPGAFVCVIGSLLSGILDRLAGYAKGTVEKTNWSR